MPGYREKNEWEVRGTHLNSNTARKTQMQKTIDSFCDTAIMNQRSSTPESDLRMLQKKFQSLAARDFNARTPTVVAKNCVNLTGRNITLHNPSLDAPLAGTNGRPSEPAKLNSQALEKLNTLTSAEKMPDSALLNAQTS